MHSLQAIVVSRWLELLGKVASHVHPPTDMHQHIVSCGCGFAPVLGVLDMVGPSAGKSLSTIDEGRLTRDDLIMPNTKTSGFARRRHCISQLPLRLCQLSALDDRLRLGFLTNGSYRQPPRRAPVRWHRWEPRAPRKEAPAWLHTTAPITGIGANQTAAQAQHHAGRD